MKTHTSSFKEQIKLMGKEIDSRITFGDTVLGKNELNAVTPSFQSAILKSAMKQLDIDSNVAIPIGTILTYEFGLKVNGEYEYINYGNYIVKSVEKQEDTKSYKITCYDMMLLSMKDYVKMPITYPITIREYIDSLCTFLGLRFANANDIFANYDKIIPNELYLDSEGNSIGYTFRDVFDELAQVTASTICLNDNDELEIRYINDTRDTIDEEFLKNVNVNFGERYGKVNSIVLSRSGESDNVYLRDEASVSTNGLTELKIVDNQIMNFNNRDEFLPEILGKLNGLEYYLNDFASTGIAYYDLCDRYNVKVGDNTYSCVMFNDELLITQGLEENIFTEMPQETETDYTKADKTDRKINQTYLIVDKQNQIIQNVVSNVNEQNNKISQVTQTVEQIQSQITDIPTITTENSGAGNLFVSNLANTKLIELRIHPTDRDILGLFASRLLKAGSTLKTLSRGITFDGSEDIYYKLPDNLYYYDNETYDEFVYNGKDEKIYVIHRVEIDEEGNKSILDSPIIEDYEYQDIIVGEGDYNVFMSTYPTAYIYIKAMIKNDYTDLFATSYEVGTQITQTAKDITSTVAETYETKAGAEKQYTEIKQTTDDISLEVAHKVDDEDFTGANIMLAINNDKSEAQINADKVDIEANDILNLLAGNEINLTSKNISIKSNNFSVDKNGKINSTSGKIGGFNIGEYALAADINDKYSYTIDDAQRATSIANGEITPTKDDYDKLDVNKDGVIDKRDATIILRKYYGYTSTQGSFSIDTTDANNIIIFTGNATQNLYTSLGIERITTSEFVVKNISTLGDDQVSNTQIDDNGITTPTVTQTSLETHKKNFEKLENAVDIIKNIDIYKYHLKSQTDDEKKHIGFVIGDDYNYSKEVTSNNNTGVDMYSFVSICCKAIQEQQEQIENLQSRIEKLEGGR